MLSFKILKDFDQEDAFDIWYEHSPRNANTVFSPRITKDRLSSVAIEPVLESSVSTVEEREARGLVRFGGKWG
ncbi:hypothetical protein DEO72_LG3g312 [Vigna unguiculata]|uniref:Uncharacterized protein n=1 Tax=Vigna unguiculata TaxID=3917 RepID=A0A4D6LB40_VIGUN|nr:hypothetical protein DEO72_LG3g312 [Vigna unguiculata]